MDITNVLAFVLAFVVGAVLSANELINTRYKKIAAFIMSSPFLYLYAVVFGFLAAGILWLIQSGAISKELAPVKTGNIIITAIGVGMCTRAFFDIKLFTLPGGGDKPVSIGVKTIIQLFEEPLIGRIDTDWMAGYRRLINMAEEKYKDHTLDQVHNMAVDGLQNFPDEARAVAFLSGGFASADDKRDKFGLYLNAFGTREFCKVFKVDIKST